jgi:SAM-dependent methyltransferase
VTGRITTGSPGLLAGPAIGQFASDIEMTGMPGVFLEHVEQDPVQRRSRTILPEPASTGTHRGQVGGLDDPPRALATFVERDNQVLDGFVRPDVPPLVLTAVAVVSPGHIDLFSGKTPLKPAALHEDQMLEQFDRGPARRQPAVPEFGLGQPVQLVRDDRPVLIQIGEDQQLRVTERVRRLGQTLGHGADRTCGFIYPRGMADGGWEWDETLYAGSAVYYARGRLPYPATVASAMRDALGLDGTGRLLDLGCGPGSFTLVAAPLFDEVVAIDADAGMIAFAAEAARSAHVINVEWRCMRAEELPADLGRFRVITFAQSFHWFDRPRVAAAVRGMLDPGGACIHVQATTHRGVDGTGPLPHPRPPREGIETLIQHYLGTVRRAGRSTLPHGTSADEDGIFRAAGFVGPDRIVVPAGDVFERTGDDVVASVFSLSSAAPHLFGSRLASFEADLRALLKETSPTGRFSEQQRDVALDIWRPVDSER